jgi:hypothetical protein
MNDDAPELNVEHDKYVEVDLVLFWKSPRQRTEVVSRGTQCSDVPRGFVDTLLCPQSFRRPQLLIGIPNLVLGTRIGEPSREELRQRNRLDL